MTFQFRLDADDKDLSNMLSRASTINNRSENEKSIMMRQKSSLSQIGKINGLVIPFPRLGVPLDPPDGHYKQDKANIFTPAPPVIRSEAEKAIYKMVKKFSARYEHVWILIARPSHEACAIFCQVFQQQKLSNLNQNLETLLSPEEYSKVQQFTREGVDVKIMMDSYAYDNFFRPIAQEYHKNNSVLEIFIEVREKTDTPYFPGRKTKIVDNLCEFIKNDVKSDLEKSRKDVPYFNFIHSNSGAELFNRRTILKNCLIEKPKDQLIEDHLSFVRMLEKYTQEMRAKQLRQKVKSNTPATEAQRSIEKINTKYNNWASHHKQFESQFVAYINQYEPLRKRSDIEQRQFYNWVIRQYAIESGIYSLINNTIRYSMSSARTKPISTFVSYLYDAIRYYSTNRHREISSVRVVYRGARVSLVEQRSYVNRRYMWNLGFTSTSLSYKVAKDFTQNFSKEQKVIFIIQIPPISSDLEFVSEHEGFFPLNRISEISSVIKSEEEEVLFNPLNIFRVKDWNVKQQILTLEFAPQLETLRKKMDGLPLNDDEKELLQSIDKLRDPHFDKGKLLHEAGDPGGAISYYQQSDDLGASLSYAQKENYIRCLMDTGKVEQLEAIFQETVESQRNSQKQLSLSNSQISTKQSRDILADSIQSLYLYRQNYQYEAAQQKADQVERLAIEKSLQMPTPQNLLLEVKAFITFAKINHEVSETLQSIRESLRSLKIIDQMANLNLCFRLWGLGREIRSLKNIKITPSTQNLHFIVNEKKNLDIDIEAFKEKTISRINEIRHFQIKGSQIWKQSNKSSQTINMSEKPVKQAHLEAENILSQYFQKRDVRSEVQILEQKFAFAYWQLKNLEVLDISNEKQQIKQKQKLRKCSDSLFAVMSDYKELFQRQAEAYEVLYGNIYKTSINIAHCLESYHKNLYRRYEAFVRAQAENQGQSSTTAMVLWKYGDILLEYGELIERPSLPARTLNMATPVTPSQKIGHQKVQEAEEIIERLETSNMGLLGAKKLYTHQKAQINRTLARYFKRQAIEKQQARKLSILKSGDLQSLKSKLTLSTTEKTDAYLSLIKTIERTKQLHNSDQSLNRPYFQIKDACEKIEVLNESSSILIVDQSYSERLKSCQSEYDNVISTLEKYKEKKLLEKGIHTAQLYLLMGENQFRLGLVNSSKEYLKKSQRCLRKALKFTDEQDEPDAGKMKRIDKEKLLLGNTTRISQLKLESHIVAFFGTEEEKKKLYSKLRAAKTTMFERMNEPLNEADINESIGLIASNLLLQFRHLEFRDAQQPFLESISIRQKLLGPYNKLNARIYTILVQLMIVPSVKSQHEDKMQVYYKSARDIYTKIDFSLDCILILYKMQLESTYQFLRGNEGEACQAILQHLKLFEQCHNKNVSMEVARELNKSSSYLTNYAQHSDQGLQWLKKCLEYINGLEKFVSKAYNLGENDERKLPIIRLKLENLKAIVRTSRQLQDSELELYNELLSKQYVTLSAVKKNE